jgi:hypothetical protein
VPRKSAKQKRAENETVTREEVVAGLKDAVSLALEKGNLTAAVSAWEKLGKAIAMFTDVQKIEDPWAAMSPEQFLEQVKSAIWTYDLFREHIRGLIREFDDAKGGAPVGSSGTPGGAVSGPGVLSAAPASGFVPRGRIH